MARVQLTLVEVDRNGATPAAVANSDSTNQQQVFNDGKVDVTVTNADSVTRNVKFYLSAYSGSVIDNGVTPFTTFAILAGATKSFYGFPVATYGSQLLIDTDAALLKLACEHKVGV
jgi:hypothetical protein